MLSNNLTKALNDQINAELYSAYLYLSMSTYAENASLKGLANWMWIQVKEEMAHAMHMYQYVLDRGANPVLAAIEKPDADYSGVKDIFEKTLAHERMVTERINNIATLAMQENDHACYQFIMWYVNEQVEEEANASDLLNKMELIGDNKHMLLNLDQELAARIFNNPFPTDSKVIG